MATDPATKDVVTFTDEQLGDMRATIETFVALLGNQVVTVKTADVEIAGSRVVHVRYVPGADEFVVDL
jgi:hypothetical protein